MQLWFRALARKCSSGQTSPLPRRSARPRPVCLRLEAVEDRTVASAVHLEPPVATLPAHQTGGTAHPGQIAKAPTDDQSKDSADDSTIAQTPGLIVEANPWGLSGFDSPTAGYDQAPLPLVREDRFTPNSATEQHLAPRPPALSDAVAPVSIERVDSPGAEEVRANKSPARPAAESAEASSAAGDAGRTSADRPGATPPAESNGDAAAASAGKPSPTTGGDRVPDSSNHRPRPSDSSTARPAQDDSHRPAPKSDGAAAARRNGRAPTPALPRNEATRLAAEVTDGSLLQRFVANREEAAFTALVRRHERLVLSVCQRVLGDWHAAQDALQTTFLVLARKAGMLDRQVPLTNWLYTVAYHAALRLRAISARHRLTETAAAQEWPTWNEGEVGTEVERLEIQQAVREELQNLPAEYREPLALCYVDGRTHNDAAREIGLPRGSMAKRLGEGLERLRERLIDRGISS
jgi:RNA polymerase sigma factor (sigma-70 family)